MPETQRLLFWVICPLTRAANAPVVRSFFLVLPLWTMVIPTQKEWLCAQMDRGSLGKRTASGLVGELNPSGIQVGILSLECRHLFYTVVSDAGRRPGIDKPGAEPEKPEGLCPHKAKSKGPLASKQAIACSLELQNC